MIRVELLSSRPASESARPQPDCRGVLGRESPSFHAERSGSCRRASWICLTPQTGMEAAKATWIAWLPVCSSTLVYL